MREDRVARVYPTVCITRAPARTLCELQDFEPIRCRHVSAIAVNGWVIPKQLRPVVYPPVVIAVNCEKCVIRVRPGPCDPLGYSVSIQVKQHPILCTGEIVAVACCVDQDRAARRPHAVDAVPVVIPPLRGAV